MRDQSKGNVMTWQEFFEDMRAVFADPDLRVWCTIGFVVIVQSVWTLFTGDIVWGLVITWTAVIFLQMLREGLTRRRDTVRSPGARLAR